MAEMFVWQVFQRNFSKIGYSKSLEDCKKGSEDLQRLGAIFNQHINDKSTFLA